MIRLYILINIKYKNKNGNIILIFYSFSIFFFCHIYSLRNRNNRRNSVIIPINRISTEDFNNSVITYEMVEGNEEIICPITQENIKQGEEIKELPCGHKFSKKIYNWIRIKNECPVCRNNVI